MGEREGPPGRGDFAVFRAITTRWSDNDVYGHVNNVRYYEFFDTLVNAHLIEAGVLDIHAGAEIGLVVETRCRYFAPLAFPAAIEGGLRAERIGTSSVTYALGIFGPGEALAAAAGEFTHVNVDRETRRPRPIAGRLREVLEALRPH